MDQDKTVNRILRDMKLFHIIECESDEAVKEYLKLVWLVGWEEGRTQVNQRFNKAIGQYNRQGKLINTFKSRREAARRTGYTDAGIKNCMNRGTPMKQGWTWKYL